MLLVLIRVMPDDATMPGPVDSHFDRVAIVDDVVVARFLVGNFLKENLWTRNGSVSTWRCRPHGDQLQSERNL